DRSRGSCSRARAQRCGCGRWTCTGGVRPGRPLLTPPHLPGWSEVAVVLVILLAGGAGQEVGEPGVAAWSGMPLVGEMAQQRLAAPRERPMAVRVVAGAAKDLGPESPERIARGLPILVCGRLGRPHQHA